MTNTRQLVITMAVAAVVCAGWAKTAAASCSDDMHVKLRSGFGRAAGAPGQSQFASRPGVVTPSSFGQGGKDDPGKDPSIVGLWRTAFTIGGQVVDEAFEVWHSDGTEVLNDTAAPATGNVCLGVWEQTARRTYKLKHPSWTFDANGQLTGTAIIGEVIKLDRDGKTFTGTATVDFFDVNENPLFHLDGEVKGQRITVD